MIVFTKSAERDLAKFDPPLKNKIGDALRAIESSPTQGSGIKRLTGGGTLYRLRSGDYRAVYEVIRGDVVVHLVAHRRDVYKRACRPGGLL